MDGLRELIRVLEPAKDTLIAALWAKRQCLKALVAALADKAHKPRADAHYASMPSSQTPAP
jgi:hypothetical protein